MIPCSIYTSVYERSLLQTPNYVAAAHQHALSISVRFISSGLFSGHELEKNFETNQACTTFICMHACTVQTSDAVDFNVYISFRMPTFYVASGTQK